MVPHPMKSVPLFLGTGALLALSLVCGGCSKPAAPAPQTQAKASPPPTPDDSLFGDKDMDTDKLRQKANKTADALGKYLDSQDPKMKAKFQKLSDKITAQLEKDKGHWREKLEAKRKELAPEIDKLRTQLDSAGDGTKDKLRAQLSALEKESGHTDEKLAKLQSAGADAWKKLKAELKADEAKGKTPPPDEDATPTPANH